MKLFCVVDKCLNFVEVNGPCIIGTTFVCKEHTPLGPDEVRFQEYQFDHDIPSGGSPQIDAEDNAAPVLGNTYSKWGEEDNEDHLRELAEEEINKPEKDPTDA